MLGGAIASQERSIGHVDDGIRCLEGWLAHYEILLAQRFEGVVGCVVVDYCGRISGGGAKNSNLSSGLYLQPSMG